MALNLERSNPAPPREPVGRVPRRRRAGERESVVRTAILLVIAMYFVFPLYWLVVASTKNVPGLFNGANGSLWFDDVFALGSNLSSLFTQSNGIYGRWLLNSLLYAVAGGVGATVLAVLAGYGFAKYAFRGRTGLFALVLGGVMVPVTALVIPTFMLMGMLELNNTYWAVILPSLLSPLGVYLMRVYSQDAIPDELLDAARIDGAGELRVFWSIALPLMRPAIATVLLLAVVATWNNYFLPLAVLSDPNLFPVTVGLSQWLTLAGAAGGSDQLWNLILVGALVSVLPLIAAFIGLQRYWQGGISLGAVKS